MIILFIFGLTLFITPSVLRYFGLSTDKILDLTYALRFLYRIFYPIAIFAFAFPKIKCKDLNYIEPLTVIYFSFLTLAVIINNLLDWKYKKIPQTMTSIFSSSSRSSIQEDKVVTGLLIYIYFTPVLGIIVIIFLIKKYFL